VGLLAQYCSVDEIQNHEIGGTCSTYGGEGRGVYSVLVGKPEGKKPLGRPRRRREDNIKMNFRKWDVGAWTGSNWLRIGTGGGH
jgi:hypothetical protein